MPRRPLLRRALRALATVACALVALVALAVAHALPGFGLTGPDPRGDYTAGRYVRLVLRVLDARGVARCALVGNPLGGTVAWEGAGRRGLPRRGHRPHRRARGAPGVRVAADDVLGASRRDGVA